MHDVWKREPCMFYGWRGETHARFMHGGGRLMHASCMEERTMHVLWMEGGDSCMHHAWWKNHACSMDGMVDVCIYVSCTEFPAGQAQKNPATKGEAPGQLPKA